MVTLGAAVAYTAVAAAVGGAVYYGSTLNTGGSLNSEGMDPDVIGDLKPTMAKEGLVVPTVFGRRRIPGNIIWYGNLTSESIVVATGGGGGKGGGGTTGRERVAGYNYKVDLWIALCLGSNVNLRSVYVDDDPWALVDFGEYVFNNGSSATYPTEPGIYASALTGVSHIFLPQMDIGTSVLIPQLQFEVEVNSTAPLTTSNFSSGISPAALIYEYLLMGGATASDIDTASFDTASEYWKSVYYGLNVHYDAKKSVRSCIYDVFNYVDGCLSVNKENQFTLKAFRASDISEVTIPKKEFSNFTFKRRNWEDLYTDYSANFMDEDQEYTKRTITIRNQATRDIIGYSKLRTVDLNAMRDIGIASNRLTEIMKKDSYPAIELSFSTSLKYNYLNIGDAVTIDNDDYGSSGLYRITKIAYGGNDKNQTTFTVVQCLESLIDSEPVTGGRPSWQESRNDPSAATHSQVRVAPYFPHIPVELNPAFFVLASRAGAEDGFGLITRDVNSTAYKAKTHYITTWAQYGTLQEAYISGSTIDDDIGILYTPEREDPIFSTISRTDLFNYTRVALIGDEYIAFQTVTYEGANNIRLTGCVRGLWGSRHSAHYIDDAIWLFDVADNLVPGITKVDMYAKFLPYFSGRGIDPADTTEVHAYVASTDLRAKPARIKVVRSGTTLTVDVWRTITRPQDWPAPTGAGFHESTNSKFLDADPAEYTEGTSWETDVFFHYHNTVDTTLVFETDPSNWSYTQAEAHTLVVYDRYYGYNYEVIFVDAADGVYENDLFSSGLRKIPHGMWGYTSVIEANNKLLNDTLLKVSGMLDVELTSLSGDDILKWNESSGKWTNVRYYAHFSTTTTTSSSTTTAA